MELSERTAREDRRKRRMREALEAAIAWYREVLLQTRAGRARPRLPGRARAHGADARSVHDRLCAEHLGGADRPAGVTRLQQRGADRRRPCQPVQPRRRDRPVPRARDHPDSRLVRSGGWPRRTDHARAGRAEVPELARRSALRQEPHPVRHRSRQGRDPAREADGHRGGLYRCDGRPPGRLRERRGQPRNGPDARPDRPGAEVRRGDRAWLRRRPGGRLGRSRRAARPARAPTTASARCASSASPTGRIRTS